ncbi:MULTISPECIES: hypothetical protein [Paenibacillus]|uniref:hypothetical protein n=1 Tax=Paenibacillus TaxID=44249 RepID=UPI0022B8AB93|nr:hypothetical protein [Paenibacillus caseinilyticus]MCZ8518113.1 hypothetical protein [Paenibacillus caseinilyticus]
MMKEMLPQLRILHAGAAWRTAAVLTLLTGWLALAYRLIQGNESLHPPVHGASLLLFVLLWNAVCLGLGIRFRWAELTMTAFTGTWLLFLLYYLQTQLSEGMDWNAPLRLAWSIYVFYTAVLFFASWYTRTDYSGLNLKLGVLNGFLLGFWMLVIGRDGHLLQYTMLAMGGIYVLLSFGLYRITRELSTPVLTKLFGGGALLLLAFIRICREMELPPLLLLTCGVLFSMGLLAAGCRLKLDLLRGGAMVVWLSILLCWFWMVLGSPSGSPVLRPGIWLLLLVSGVLLCRRAGFTGMQEEDRRIVNGSLVLLSHICLGGLTASILQSWTTGLFLPLELALSAVWGLQALLLFLWGTCRGRKRFQAFGSFGLICVFVKALMFDLSASGLREKLLVLLVLALVSLAAAAVNHICGRRSYGSTSDVSPPS